MFNEEIDQNFDVVNKKENNNEEKSPEKIDIFLDNKSNNSQEIPSIKGNITDTQKGNNIAKI